LCARRAALAYALVMADSGDAFWEFSLGFYARAGVSAACLALQDRHGRDVNLVLLACWLGLSGRGRLDAGDWARAEAVAEPWRRSVIEPLRLARRALKREGENAAALYAAAKAVELDAERLAQRRLAVLAPAPSGRSAADRTADATASLALYLADPAAREAAGPIVAAIATRAS
jgi:uncharacterized protein (TIGR02444 family)